MLKCLRYLIVRSFHKCPLDVFKYFHIVYKFLLAVLGIGKKKKPVGCCFVQLDEPSLLTKVVLAIVTSELSASG